MKNITLLILALFAASLSAQRSVSHTINAQDYYISYGTRMAQYTPFSEPPPPPPTPGTTVNEIMGRGFNVTDITGNDGTMNWELSEDGVEMDILAAEGVGNIRFAAWYFGDNNSAPWTIQPSVLTNLGRIIDEITSRNMVCVINYHQPYIKRHNLFNQDQIDRFISHWEQVAAYCSSRYDSTQVVYELMNEPEYRDRDGTFSPMTADNWNDIMQDAVDAIRAYDTEKYIMITPHGWSKVWYLDNMVVPIDPAEMLMCTLHDYEPKWMQLQGAAWDSHGTEWLYNDWPNIWPFWHNLAMQYKIWEDWNKDYNLPLNIGEWGTVQGAISTEMRANYARMKAHHFESIGASSAWWEWQDPKWDFTVFNKVAGTWDEDMKNAILHDVLPPFEGYDSVYIYDSDFTTDTDGWTASTSGGGAVSLSVSNGRLAANVTNGGSGTADVRLRAPMMDFIKGDFIRVKYTVSGNKPFFADLQNPNFNWFNVDDLSGGGSFTRTFTYEMAWDDYLNTWFQFYVGGSTGVFYIDKLTIEKITPTGEPGPDPDPDPGPIPNYIDILYEEDFDDFPQTTTHAATTPTGIQEADIEAYFTRCHYLGSDDYINPTVADMADIVAFGGSNVLKSWYLEGNCCTGAASDWDATPGNLGTGIDVMAYINADHSGEQDLWLIWDVYFMEGFQNSEGMKQPGLKSLKGEEQESYASRIMLNKSGDNNLAVAYYTTAHWYNWDETTYLTNTRDIDTPTGQWVNFAIHVTAGYPLSTDGTVEIFVNGISAGWVRNVVPFRNATAPEFAMFNLTTFMGGNYDIFASPIDQWSLYDNIKIFTSSQDLGSNITAILSAITDFPRY